LSVPEVAHSSTDIYPAGWLVLTELFGLMLVCRHERHPCES